MERPQNHALEKPQELKESQEKNFERAEKEEMLLFSKFRGKAGKLVKALALTTLIAGATKEGAGLAEYISVKLEESAQKEKLSEEMENWGKNKEKMLLKIAEEKPEIIAHNPNLIISEPGGKKALLEATQSRPFIFFDSIKKYTKLPEESLEEIVSGVAKKNPMITLVNIEKLDVEEENKNLFKKIQREILRTAPETHSYKILNYQKEVGSLFPEKRKDVIERAVKSMENKGRWADLVFQYENYSFLPESHETLKRAISNIWPDNEKLRYYLVPMDLIIKGLSIAKEETPDFVRSFIAKKEEELLLLRPWIILDYFDVLKDLPSAETLLEKSIRKTLSYYEVPKISENLPVFIDKPWAEDILIKTAKIWGGYELLNNIEIIAKKPFYKKILKTLAENHPVEVLKYYNKYKNIEGSDKTLEIAVKATLKEYPSKLVKYWDIYSDLPEAEKYKKEAAEKSLEDKTQTIFLIQEADKIAEEPYGQDILQKASQINSSAAITYLPQKAKQLPGLDKILEKSLEQCIQNKNYYKVIEKKNTYKEIVESWEKFYKQALDLSSQTNPKSIITVSVLDNGFFNYPYAVEKFKTAVINDPAEFIANFYTGDEEVEDKLKESGGKIINTILKILHSKNLTIEEKTKTSALVQSIANGSLTLDEAANYTTKNGDDYLKELIKIKSLKDHAGAFSIDTELADLALRKVQNINELHNQPDNLRFSSVETNTAKELYVLLTYGEEEVFTSTFNGLFDRMVEKMKKEKINIMDLLQSTNFTKFRNIISLTAEYNRLNDLLDLTNKENQKIILEKVGKNIEKTKDPLSQSIILADIFSMVEDPKIIDVFKETIKSEYSRVSKEGNREAVTLYGLLASMFAEKDNIDEEWIKKIAKKYKLPDIINLDSEKLFNKKGECIQQYFFYDDREGYENNPRAWDGHFSFKLFMSMYGARVSWDSNGKLYPIKEDREGNWHIEDKKSYVKITSSKKGKKIIILANKPDQEYSGIAEIRNNLKETKQTPQIIVHRGHSYHADETINEIPENVKLVSLGSCGGYKNIDKILKKSPDAHIISTKGTGTMSVNDPLLKSINDNIREGNDINWPQFWQLMEKKLGHNEEFYDYIPPHKNLGALFIKAYKQKIKEKDG